MINMKRTIIICLFFIFCWGHANTWAVEEVIVMTEQFPPFNFQENQSIKGISTQIVKRLMDEAKIKYKIKIFRTKG